MMMPSVAVHALGMGEIEVHSSLNEPLKARIKLLSVTAGELSALQVVLASDDAFSRMGIERTPTLRDLRFEVVTQGAGTPYISIVSSAPMREPFLDLILMANWSNGQLMREYTLLLDPPVFDKGEAVAPVMAARTESAAIDRGQKKAAVVAPAATSAPWVAPAGSYGPTSRTDTLWSVAREMRPNSSVTVPQMMVALLKENPEAFADGNVNNLKSGYILRAPARDVINSMSGAQAAAEVNRHYQEWQAAGGKSPAVNRRQRLAATTAAPSDTATGKAAAIPAVAAEGSARLKLLSPEDARQQGGTGSSVQGKGTATEQLAIALETAEATKQENAELKARLTDLERQLQAVQRLLTLKGDTLGALQAGLGEQAPGGGSQQPGVAGGAPVAGQAGQAPEVAATGTATPIEPAPGIKPAPVAQPTTVAETGLIDQLLANPVLLAAAAGGPLLLLLVASLIRRRRQQAELEEIDSLSGGTVLPGDEERAPGFAMNGAGAGILSKSDEQGSGQMVDETVSTGFGTVSSAGAAIHTEENEIDPIAEADVYLAYRRYEQAEALLKEAIRNDSGRNELKLKLLEIYFTTKDRDAFEAQAEALYAALAGREDELWTLAVEMGREIAPEHPLFAEAGGSPSAGAGVVAASALGGAAAGDKFDFEKASTDLDDEFSFDLSDDDLASSLNISSAAEREIGGGGDVFDLGAAEGAEDILPSLDDADLSAGDGLEELSAADEFSLDDGVPAATGDDLLTLDDDLAAISEGGELDLGTLNASEELADGFGLDDALVAGDALNEFDSGLEALSEGLDVDGSVRESDEWTIAPAVSSFQSHDVKSEMDDGYVPVTNVVKGGVSSHNLDHLSLDESELDLEGGLESNIFDGSDDLVGTKLDLARAYIDMGDQSGARSILDEVVKEGGDSHRQEAEQLMRQIS